MNKFIRTVFTFIAIVGDSFVALAYIPPPEPVDQGVPGLDNPALPIDGYVWVLLVIGLCFVFYKHWNTDKFL